MPKLLAIMLSGFCLVAGATPNARGSAAQLRIGLNGIATVEGRVLENHLGCRQDLACYLRLGLADEEVRVYYHQGEYRACLDARTARQAEAIAAGARVRAVGRYRHTGHLHVLDVCAAPGAVLQVLSQP